MAQSDSGQTPSGGGDRPADPPIVRLRGLCKSYGDFSAVDRLNLAVPYGRVFGVLGPNGAGKTTTLRMITGLLRPTGGEISIDGHNIADESVAAKKVTGFIPDRPYVYDKLTGFEYLKFIGGIYGMTAGRIGERMLQMLELFELRPWGDRLIESFSHGMKQRLVFAGALLPKPKLLVVDEPMVGLDPKGHRLIKNLFGQLAHDSGVTVLLSTHTLEVAEEVCDQIVIINHGRIIARGDLGELRRLTQLEADADADEAGSLEQVFLRLTEESNQERARAVAQRFGRSGDGSDDRRGMP